MTDAIQPPTVSALIERARARCMESKGVPPEIAEKAARATFRTFGTLDSLDSLTVRRIEAYFSAVVRRTLIRTRTAPGATARFVIDAVVSDLAQSGRDPRAVWDELHRSWRDKVPGEVLEEYRQRLCA